MKLSAGKYGLVLCEGREDAHVLMRIAEAAELKQIKIQDYQGKDNLAAYLKMLVKSSDFISGRIQKILITRDADESYAAAREAANSCIRKIITTEPISEGEWLTLNNGIAIAIWIAPGMGRSGMIESLCLEAAEQSKPDTFDCLLAYSNCLREKHQIELHEKERFAIWSIAAQGAALGRKRLPLLEVIQRINFDWSHSAFSEISRLMYFCNQPAD